MKQASRPALRSAYFPEFKGSPSILLWGDVGAVRSLADLFREASSDADDRTLTGCFDAADGREIVLRLGRASAGMLQRDKGFEWALGPESMRTFVDLLDGLTRANEPGHQYLTCNLRGEIMVIVSHAEFPLDFVP